MNTHKKLIALLLHTIISIAIVMLIVGCPIDSDNNDTTAPTISSAHANSKKAIITFSEAIKFGSAGSADGTGFTVKAGSTGSLETVTGITATISGSILTLTFGSDLTNTQTHVQVEFEDNAIADTAGNTLDTNINTGKITVDTTAPTITYTRISTSGTPNISMMFSEPIMFGSTVGTTLNFNGTISILHPKGFTIETGTTDALGTSKQVKIAAIGSSPSLTKVYVLSVFFDGELETGTWAQVTFGEDTIIDLAGNALATNTKSNKVQVEADS